MFLFTIRVRTRYKLPLRYSENLLIQDLIWEQELRSQAQKIEFPNRWDAEVICDDLEIDLDLINRFEPFNGNAIQKFIPLIGNNAPSPLSNEKYADFTKFIYEILHKI